MTDVNIDPNNGTPYGCISANALHPEVVDTLMYGPQAKDLSEKESMEQYRAQMMRDIGTDEGDPYADIEALVERAAERGEFEHEEPTIEGVYEGVKYSTLWMGGALNIVVYESPYIATTARKGGVCVPNMAILDTLDGYYQGYDVPPDWRATDDQF